MEPIAQTSIQLYNQLRRQGRSEEDLGLVRRACDLTRSLYSGHHQADGVPFSAHVTGVASIVAHLGLPADAVAAACLHNVYTNGDFGDGRLKCATATRRRLVANTVSPEVEALVHGFWTLLRLRKDALRNLGEQAETLTARDRQLLVMDLADTLEKCHALGPLYYGDSGPMLEFASREGPGLVALAERLGYPELAAALSAAIGALCSERIPRSLQSADPSRKYMRLELSRSCIQRPDIVARRRLRRWWTRIGTPG